MINNFFAKCLKMVGFEYFLVEMPNKRETPDSDFSPEELFEPTPEQLKEWKELYDNHFDDKELTNVLYNLDYKTMLVRKNRIVDIVPLDFEDECFETQRMYKSLNIGTKSEIVNGNKITLYRRLVQFVGPFERFENYYSRIARGYGSFQSDFEVALICTLWRYIAQSDDKFQLRIIVNTPEERSVDFEFTSATFDPKVIRLALIKENILSHLLYHKIFRFELIRIEKEEKDLDEDIGGDDIENDNKPQCASHSSAPTTNPINISNGWSFSNIFSMPTSLLPTESTGSISTKRVCILTSLIGVIAGSILNKIL